MRVGDSRQLWGRGRDRPSGASRDVQARNVSWASPCALPSSRRGDARWPLTHGKGGFAHTVGATHAARLFSRRAEGPRGEGRRLAPHGGGRGPKPSAHEVPARGWCLAPGGPQVPRGAPQGPHHRRELGQGRATGGSSGSSRDPRGLQRRSSRLGRRGARARGRAAGFPAPSVRAVPGSQRKDLG